MWNTIRWALEKIRPDTYLIEYFLTRWPVHVWSGDVVMVHAILYHVWLILCWWAPLRGTYWLCKARPVLSIGFVINMRLECTPRPSLSILLCQRKLVNRSAPLRLQLSCLFLHLVETLCELPIQLQVLLSHLRHLLVKLICVPYLSEQLSLFHLLQWNRSCPMGLFIIWPSQFIWAQVNSDKRTLWFFVWLLSPKILIGR